MTRPFVVDASVAASWLFRDESDARATRALAALEDSVGLVPLLWHYEMRHILLVALRRQRITRSEFSERTAALPTMPLTVDAGADLDSALSLAERHGLSFYDALYLELASRRQGAIASLDAKLLAAAEVEGIETI